MNWLRRVMAGRYGSDQLSTALLVLSIFFMLISRLSSWLYFASFLSYIPLALAILRTFSKDIYKRRAENYKFMMLLSPLYSKLLRYSRRIKDLKTHKYYRCPNCKQQLRVPKGKGKICITCRSCRTEFIKKT
ncbi:MAG: hypothetical protein GX660_08420 [Clostridiaceae bacterium]|nr:hypothetical protein [Clostridiaceae bacterium]